MQVAAVPVVLLLLADNPTCQSVFALTNADPPINHHTRPPSYHFLLPLLLCDIYTTSAPTARSSSLFFSVTASQSRRPPNSRSKPPHNSLASMAVKDCGGHKGGCECHRERLYRKVCGAVTALVLLVLFVVLVVWLVLRPHKPRFYLQDLSVLCLNVTPPASTYLFTTMQATVAARNGNDHVGVYYDKVDVYAQYKGVAITVPTQLPVEYQGHRDQSVWSPYLQSMDSVVLPPALAVALAQDETAGYVLVDIRVDGWIRWKVGTWISGHYHLRVNCPALLTVNEGKGSYGSNTGGGSGYFRFQQAAACAVDV